MKKKISRFLLILLLADTIYSFFQFYHTPLYGDIAEIVLPKPGNRYYQILHDPFGLNVLLRNEIYLNPNRFFANWSVSTYFKNIPFVLQKFVKPIESVYLSCAIAKIIFQILIIYLLSVYIGKSKNILRSDFIIAASLITPLFQTYGFNRYMGIIDHSVIYSFFYALPMGLLLLFLLPFYNTFYYNSKLRMNYLIKSLWFLLMVVLTLSGPLIPGVVLILCTLVLLNMGMKNFKQMEVGSIFKRIWFSIKKMRKIVLFYFIGISILSIYSLYIGKNNTSNYYVSSTLIQQYSKLYHGILNLSIEKSVFPLFLLIIAISVNMILIRKNYKSDEGNKILKLIRWIGIFSIIYILLLPLGGFRIYRPYIIRYDTIMPITIGIIFAFGSTSFYVIKNITGRHKKIYLPFVLIFLMFFTIIDGNKIKDYECEKKAIETIAQSTDKIVRLDSDCPVMEWHKIYDYKQSEYNAELFYYWNITKEKKYYFFNQTH